MLLHKKVKIIDASPAVATMFGYDLAEMSGLTILDLMIPEGRGTVLRHTLIQYPHPYEVLGLKKDGTTFPVEIIDSALALDGLDVRVMSIRAITENMPTETILIALQKRQQEIARRVRESTTDLRFAKERLQLELDERILMEAQLRKHARQQAAVAEVGRRALAGMDTEMLLDEALAVAAQTLEVEFIALFELLPGGEQLILRKGVGWPDSLIGSASLTTQGNSPMAYALRANEPVIFEDLSNDPRFQPDTLLPDQPIMSGMSVILRGWDQPTGVLAVYTSRQRLFTEDDIQFLQAIATLVGMEMERRRAENRLKSALQEKETLLREIHHRVKNNLQIISSLLSLQTGYIADPQVREIVQEGEQRIRSMALIHEKLYRSENLAEIDFARYIHDLVGYLFRLYDANNRGISLDIQADPILLSIHQAIPCGLILNELISNALKHAFTPTGAWPDGRSREIRIGLKAGQDRQITLTVADNGVGLPAGFDLEQTSSLGLRLVYGLAEQIDGLVELNSQGGTQFQLKFSNFI